MVTYLGRTTNPFVLPWNSGTTIRQWTDCHKSPGLCYPHLSAIQLDHFTTSQLASAMRTLVVGIGGMTNGGKSTMSSSLHLRIPNSCIIAQDAFFKDDSVIALDSNGFKQYDVLDALHMDRMMSNIESWRKDPDSFLASQSLKTQCSVGEEVFVLIVEGFLIFNYGPLNELMDKRYFLEIPYDICKERRGSRVYTPPDLPGYFDGYVWPMYLKNRQEMEDMVLDIVFLDGLKSKEDLLDYVYGDVTMEMQRLMGKDLAV